MLLEDSQVGTFNAAGIEDIKHFPYLGCGIQWSLCGKHDLENSPEQCVVVLFASGHHPTGAELSQEDWKRVAEVMVVKSHKHEIDLKNSPNWLELESSIIYSDRYQVCKAS